MIKIDPITRQRIVYQEHSGDIEYNLTGGSAISTQVIPKLNITRSNQINLGRSNALFGSDESLKGARLPDIGITGQNKQTTDRLRIRRRVEV